MNNMKLGYLVANFPQLSETFVSNEIDRLINNGLDINIYSFVQTSEDDAEKLTEVAKELAVKTNYLSKISVLIASVMRPWDLLRLSGINKKMQKWSTSKPNQQMRKCRAIALAHQLRRDGITHLHVHWPYSTEVAYLVNQLINIPYSVSIHAHEVAHENGHFPPVFKTLSFATYCNKGAMEYLLKQLPEAARKKSYLVYHGVDIRNFEPLPMPLLDKTLNIITAGRLTKTKGFDRLIRACAKARKQDFDIRLSILGRGTVENEIKAVAKEEDFTDYLDMPGWVSHDKVREYMKNAHLFALLADTSFHDGLPNVVLEAMACSRPVILSPLPAAGEAVADGKEGFILESAEDYDGFVTALKKIYDAPEILTTMGNDARTRVCHDHDADKQIIYLQDMFIQQAQVFNKG
ncbi:MAG: hypothetical protein COA54_01260 [Thiotrichaceae bacterium]|nr:MAG: hypothetical protein COA54_01260 [Thiotrichaceae bacterium]